MDVNKAILIGRLTNDPISKKTKMGTEIVSCGIATNYVWKDLKTKKLNKIPEFHNLFFCGHLVSVVTKYLKKGDRVYIEGRIRTKKLDDNSKLLHYKTDIIVSSLVMLGGKKAEESMKEVAVEEIVVED